MNKISTQDRRALIRLASTMEKGSQERGVILRKVAEGGAGGSGKFVEFMEEVGDQKVRNPDTGNEVKVKSLKGDKGKKLVQEQFQKWLKPKGDKPKGDKPKGDKPKGDKPKGDKPKGDKIPKIEDDMKDTLKRVQEDIKKYDDFRAKLKKGPLSRSQAADFRELEEHVHQGRGPISDLIEYFEFIGREDLDTPEAAAKMVRLMGKKASDRKALIRLASSMPVGSQGRRAILSGLKKEAKKGWEVSVSFGLYDAFVDNHPEDGEPNPWVSAYIEANERTVVLELEREDGANDHHEIRAKWDRRQTPEEQEESARDLLDEMQEELERGDIPNHPYNFSRLF